MLFTSSTGRGIAIPLGSIHSAEAIEGGDWRVVTKDGDSHDFSKIDWELWIEGTPVQSWPAQAGTYVVYPEREANDRQFWKTAVVGWMINLANEVRPVVTDPDGISKEWYVM
ncbi:MAG: hypothetical protein VYB32_08055, partial [Pseudomonadota bacterium]|nr:hypothetical protein [Pseudomonadota bacterium]